MGISPNKPIFVVDLDDVINNLVEVWLEEYNRKYNDSVIIDDIKGWDIGSYTKAGNEMYVLLDTPKLFSRLRIKENCAEVLKWAIGYFDVQIVSASRANTIMDKVEFLQRELPFIPVTSFNAVTNKYLIKSDVMIDDKPENLMYATGIRLLFDRPWNEDCKKYTRVKDWEAVKRILKNYLENEVQFHG